MRNLQLWSRSIDYRILGFVLCFLTPGLVGFALPTPGLGPGVRIIDAFLAVGLVGVLWGAYHVVRSPRLRTNLAATEVLMLSLVWVLLILCLGIWFWHLNAAWAQFEMKKYETVPLVL